MVVAQTEEMLRRRRCWWKAGACVDLSAKDCIVFFFSLLSPEVSIQRVFTGRDGERDWTRVLWAFTLD